MPDRVFQYDESGEKFYCFVIAFLVLILIPSTIYYWPRKNNRHPEKKNEKCQCINCIKKERAVSTIERYLTLKFILTKILIILGWILLAFLIYRLSQFEHENARFDPFKILNISPSASIMEIKKAYRRMSLVLHPDKLQGDEEAFIILTKAYQTLTNLQAKENFEKYGNPDGPEYMSFGIALPSWIVEKENSIWILGLYGLVFMIALPLVIGMWWYRSIRYSSDKVLMGTTQLYFYLFHRTPHMMLKRTLMVLAASLEFDKRYNSQVMERESDYEEVRVLIRQLPNFNENFKNNANNRIYSIKTLAILYAHLLRINLNSTTLEKDRQFIVKNSLYLIEEMICCAHKLIKLAYTRSAHHFPNIETIENCMKLSPMIIQALWQCKSPLLQLPHINENHLSVINKKKSIKNLQQLAFMRSEERRLLLKSLNDFEYENVVNVLAKMPLVDISVHYEVIDDENKNIVTAEDIVTVTVLLNRQNMSSLYNDVNIVKKPNIKHNNDDDNCPQNSGNEEENSYINTTSKALPVWATRHRKGKGGGRNVKKGFLKNQKKKIGSQAISNVGRASIDDRITEIQSIQTDIECDLSTKNDKMEIFEDDLSLLHTVHCPFFPKEKKEFWWIYICDRKTHKLLTVPYQVKNLVNKQEIQLQFTAPQIPGVYTFVVCLKSDSYIGLDQQLDFKVDVEKKTEMPSPYTQCINSESESASDDDQNNFVDWTFTSDEDTE